MLTQAKDLVWVRLRRSTRRHLYDDGATTSCGIAVDGEAGDEVIARRAVPSMPPCKKCADQVHLAARSLGQLYGEILVDLGRK